MPRKKEQSDLFEKDFAKKPDRFGGGTRTTRKSRKFRPISTRQSMHLMLKSTRATGQWSFLTPKNKRIVKSLLKAYSFKHHIQILSAANAGNHLHIHLKVQSALAYKRFVRAFSGAIAMKISGASKIKKLKNKFWTQSPYTRFVHGVRDFLRLRDYIRVNILEGFGVPRLQAEYIIKTTEWPESS